MGDFILAASVVVALCLLGIWMLHPAGAAAWFDRLARAETMGDFFFNDDLDDLDDPEKMSKKAYEKWREGAS